MNLIVASDENRLIGDGNRLPWRIKEELQYFKKMTEGSVCVMGRKTFESLPKPLSNRTNLVITRGTLSNLYFGQGYDIQTTSIFEYIPERYPKRDIWVIGGKTIYEQFLDKGLIDCIYHSVVFGNYEGDVYLKEFPKEFVLESENTEYSQFIIKKYKKIINF
jgi:dihydrofolate reductase